MAMIAAGAVVAGEEIWMPGKKLISIPKYPIGQAKNPVNNIQEANMVTFTIRGLEAGDTVYTLYEGEHPKDGQIITSDLPTIEQRILYTTDREVLVRVRNGGINPIKSFEARSMLTSEGFDLNVLRISDL